MANLQFMSHLHVAFDAQEITFCGRCEYEWIVAECESSGFMIRCKQCRTRFVLSNGENPSSH